MNLMPDDADQGRQTRKALSRLLVGLASWLVEVGTWIFGGLIALNLIVIAALITVGPVDAAVLIAVTAFACALPLEVAGMVMLRLRKDVEDMHLESLALRSFEEAHFPNVRAYFPPPHQRDSLKRRRVRITLGYALAIATLSVALTLTGIVATLWHMAPWVAEASLATGVLAVVLILVVIAHAMPPVSEAERQLKDRYRGQPGNEKREQLGHSEDPS